MSIYDIFSKAASVVEKAPFRTRLLAGFTAGGVVGAMTGNPDEDITTRFARGAFIGSAIGFGSAAVVRGVGRFTERAGMAGLRGIQGLPTAFKGQAARFSELRRAGVSGLEAARKSFATYGNVMLAGAGIGALVAPPGSRLQGAAIGAGVGVLGRMAMPAAIGYSKLGKVPLLGTPAQAALLSSVGFPILAYGTFRTGAPASEVAGIENMGDTAYQPMTSGVADRITAMSASGDIVMGLNNRRHG